ncbi:MAG: winged helix-turn-helix domain-containing protein [Candidatus Nanohaloarchaea archaeon]
MGFFLVNEDGFLETEEIDSDGLKALDNDTRLNILELASKGNITVPELVDQLGTDDQTAYYHVQMMEEKGILEAETGNPKIYSLSSNCFFYRPENTSFNRGPVNARETPDLLENIVEDVKVIVEDSSPDYFPEYRYKAGEITSLVGKFGETSKRVLTSSEAERIGLESGLIAVGNPEHNKLVKDICRKNDVSVRPIEIENRKFSAPRTGIVLRSDDQILISGNSDLGVSSAIRAFSDMIDEIEKGAIVQGFGSPMHVEDVDVLHEIG